MRLNLFLFYTAFPVTNYRIVNVKEIQLFYTAFPMTNYRLVNVKELQNPLRSLLLVLPLKCPLLNTLPTTATTSNVPAAV